MIEKKSLMIGNWVILDWDGDKRYLTIETIGRNDVEFEEWDEEFSYSNLYPIPLTGEILEKCGFDLTPHEQSHDILTLQPEWENIEYRVIEFPTGNWIVSKGFFNWNDELCTVKYLHQLQNTIWVIAGFELTFNP